MQLLGAGLRTVGQVSPAAAGDLITYLLSTTWRPKRPLRENETLRDAIPVGVQLGGTRLSALQWGEGPVVILAHGWNGRGTQLGAFVRPLVDRGYRVVAFDAPGHGETPGHRCTMASIADSITAVGRAVWPVHAVIGHSAGALAAMLAQVSGLDAKRLVLLAPPAGPITWVQELAEELHLGEDVKQRVIDRIEDHMARWPSIRGPEVARSMEAPMLVIHDEDDTEVDWERARAIADAAPLAELVTTHGLGHRRILRDADVVRRVVDFIDDTVPRSRS
ncbi:MAG: alpha/beta fold hydrolase [bacterium]